MILHYKAVEYFRKEYFKNLLTEEHLVDSEKFIKKYTDINGEEYEMNEFVYVMQKEGKKYLIPTSAKKNLPVGYSKTEKIAIRDEAYYRVLDPYPAKFVPERKLSMRELINVLSSFKHSQPLQYKIDVMTVITQIINKAFFRKSSTQSFGKDSTVGIIGGLSLKALTIENPTIAKLELLSNTKLLAINELNDLSKADWKMIEQFLLAVGAFKETYTKRSRATAGVGEILDISNLSVGVMYNDIDCYEDSDKYFDMRATKQCKDRLPALRYYGSLEEDFNVIDSLNIESFVKQHWDDYTNIIKTIAYYSIPSNVIKELKQFKTELLSDSNRWNNSLNKLLRIVDLYSNNQEEFDQIVSGIKLCMQEYQAMTRYPTLVQKLATHYKLTKDDRKGIYRFKDLLYWLEVNTPEVKKQKDAYKTIVSTIHKYINEQSFIKVEQLVNEQLAQFERDKEVVKKSVSDLNNKHW